MRILSQPSRASVTSKVTLYRSTSGSGLSPRVVGSAPNCLAL
ncbi:hypothetical protein [Achromobacter mucicolens]|nr:hypothetical protein [Achromobacter mucicolens]WBX91089.1 hypothetical protein PE062_10750 [Achromobacter mucicolens]